MSPLIKNRLKLVFIATLFALPVITAWTVFKNPQWLEGGKTKNHGELISPAIPSKLSDYIINGSDVDLADLSGRWVLLHLDLDGVCDKSCEKSVFTLRQLHVLLNKDAKRLKRVYFDKSNGKSKPFLVKDALLKVFTWDQENVQKLKTHINNIVDGDMLLIDPLGNILMKYHHDADPYGIQKDLKLLFKTSQIG